MSTESAIRSFADQRRYRATTVDRWLALAVTDAAALLDVAEPLRLGENQLCDLWGWLDEIATRDATSLAAVLNSPALAKALQSKVGRNDKIKLLKTALRRLRYPQLVEVEDRLAALIRHLALPREVRVSVPDFLEGDTLRVEITVRDATALQAAAGALLRAAEQPSCAAIFRLLEEAP